VDQGPTAGVTWPNTQPSDDGPGPTIIGPRASDLGAVELGAWTHLGLVLLGETTSSHAPISN
jgi:hypothetical protein